MTSAQGEAIDTAGSVPGPATADERKGDPSAFIVQIKTFAVGRALMAALELGVLPALAEAPISRDELMRRCGISPSLVADGFLDVLISAGALTESNGAVGLTAMSRATLPSHASLVSWNREMHAYYTSLADLAGLLRSGDYRDTDLAKFWAYKHHAGSGGVTAQEASAYSLVMDQSQAELSEAVLRSHDWAQYSTVIDFGGGMGRLALALAREGGVRRVIVADLPVVCEHARKRIADLGIGGPGGQVECLALDFMSEALPKSVADAIVFSRVLHDWNDEQAARLLSLAHASLRPGGEVVIIEPITGEDVQTGNLSSSVSALMLSLLGGKRRSIRQYEEMLNQAGFRDCMTKALGLSLYKSIRAVAHTEPQRA